MLKNILRLLAVSTSFVALLLVIDPSSAIASTLEINLTHQFSSPTVSLNVVSPAWQLANDTDIVNNHFGCTCHLCTQSLEQSTSN